MIEIGKPPTGEELLRLLARLYADQMGVNIEVEIVEVGEDERRQQACV